jgi:serine/threonine protein kinase
MELKGNIYSNVQCTGYLHQNNISHRALKVDNISVQNDQINLLIMFSATETRDKEF